MGLRLAEGVQVRKEVWGLLFYLQNQHRLVFIRSGDWLLPEHFEQSWTRQSLAADIGRRVKIPAAAIERTLEKTLNSLERSGIVTDGLC